MQIDLERDINNNTVVVGDFNCALSHPNRLPRLKFNKDILTLKEEIEELG